MAGAITNLLSNYTSLSYKVTPLWNNVICSLITVIYVKAILTIGAKLRDRLRCAYESRKLVHMGAACWILFWPLFDVSHWTWRLNILVPTVMGIKLVYKVSSVLFCSVQFCSVRFVMIDTIAISFVLVNITYPINTSDSSSILSPS